MSIQLEEKLYTVPEFLDMEWPDDDECDYELLGGRIVAKSGTTSGKHGDVVIRIGTELNIFAGVKAGEKRIGKVYVETSTTLGQPEGSYCPKPDVCFVRKGNGPEEFDGAIPVAPDLVVEVWSPSDTDERRLEKIQMYQANGVKLIWSIHMLDKYIMVYRLNRPRSFLDLEDELDGEEVVPGFKLKVNNLFN